MREDAQGRPPAARIPKLPRRRSAGAELEVALPYDLLLDQVDQEGATLADHSVEGQQIPDVHGPADVPALARRRPLGRLQVAEAGRSNPSLPAQVAERRRRPHDLDRAGRCAGLDLSPPL